MSEIPDAAKKAFSAKFPEAQNVTWSIEKPGEFEADFVAEGTASSALFNKKGNFILSEVVIKNNELPQSVKTTLANDLAGYVLYDIEKVTDAEGIITFEMKGKNKNESLEFTFSSDGKLLRKELLKAED